MLAFFIQFSNGLILLISSVYIGDNVQGGPTKCGLIFVRILQSFPDG